MQRCAIATTFVLSLSIANAQSKDHPEETRLIESIQGPALYKAYCASCHGIAGKGDGPMLKSLKVAPADLTRIAKRNGGTFPSARISKVISGQEPLANGHGSSEMPVWGPVFAQVAWDQDLGRVRIDNLTRYLHDLQSR